jgi:hypothetical protein
MQFDLPNGWGILANCSLDTQPCADGRIARGAGKEAKPWYK